MRRGSYQDMHIVGWYSGAADTMEPAALVSLETVAAERIAELLGCVIDTVTDIVASIGEEALCCV